MKKILFTCCALFFAMPLFALNTSSETFRLLNFKELKAMIDDSNKNPVHIFDANGDKTRAENGIIPGAKLLSSPSKYDVAGMLPLDRKAALVFYCYNPKCTASHTAAEKAIKAGYTNVAVFSDGIIGWISNGQSVLKPH